MFLSGGAAWAQTEPARPAPPSAPMHDCLCLTNSVGAAVSFEIQFSGRAAAPWTLAADHQGWYCLPVGDTPRPLADAALLLKTQPSAPTQVTRYRAPLVRTADRSCSTIGPRSQFSIKRTPDGQGLTLEVREATPTVAELDAAAWQRHKASLTAAGVRAATHGEDAARICRHLSTERRSEIDAVRRRQPANATPIQVERTRMHLLSLYIASLDLACRDQPEYEFRGALLARLERSALACHALGGRGAECEPAAAW